jgi:hypothetical protein
MARDVSAHDPIPNPVKKLTESRGLLLFEDVFILNNSPYIESTPVGNFDSVHVLIRNKIIDHCGQSNALLRPWSHNHRSSRSAREREGKILWEWDRQNGGFDPEPKLVRWSVSSIDQQSLSNEFKILSPFLIKSATYSHAYISPQLLGATLCTDSDAVHSNFGASIDALSRSFHSVGQFCSFFGLPNSFLDQLVRLLPRGLHFLNLSIYSAEGFNGIANRQRSDDDQGPTRPKNVGEWRPFKFLGAVISLWIWAWLCDRNGDRRSRSSSGWNLVSWIILCFGLSLFLWN